MPTNLKTTIFNYSIIRQKSFRSLVLLAALLLFLTSIFYLAAPSSISSAAPPPPPTTFPPRNTHFLNSNYIGTKRVAVVNFETKLYKNPVRTSNILPLLTGTTNSAKSYYAKASNGNLNLTSDSKSIFGGSKPYVLSKEFDSTCSGQSISSMMDEAYAKAKAGGLDGSIKADMVIYIGPTGVDSCLNRGEELAGLTLQGYGDTIIFGQPYATDLRILTHEMGHSFYFGHAGVLNCYQGTKKITLSSIKDRKFEGCKTQNDLNFENGDFMDVMSALSRKPNNPLVDPSGFRKTSAGWDNNHLEVSNSSDGTYTVYNSEAPVPTGQTGYHSIRVPIPATITGTPHVAGWYEFETRQDTGLILKFQDFLNPNEQKGVQTKKLDMNPMENDENSRSGLYKVPSYEMAYYDADMKMLVSIISQDSQHTTFSLKFNAERPAGLNDGQSGPVFKNISYPYNISNHDLTINYEVYVDDPATPGLKDALFTTPFGFSPIRVKLEGSFEVLKGDYPDSYFCTPALNPGYTGFHVLNSGSAYMPYDDYSFWNYKPLGNDGKGTLTACPFQKGLRPASPNASAYYLGQQVSIDGYGDNYDRLNADGSINYYGIDPYIDLRDNAPSTQTFQFFLRKK